MNRPAQILRFQERLAFLAWQRAALDRAAARIERKIARLESQSPEAGAPSGGKKKPKKTAGPKTAGPKTAGAPELSEEVAPWGDRPRFWRSDDWRHLRLADGTEFQLAPIPAEWLERIYFVAKGRAGRPFTSPELRDAGPALSGAGHLARVFRRTTSAGPGERYQAVGSILEPIDGETDTYRLRLDWQRARAVK